MLSKGATANESRFIVSVFPDIIVAGNEFCALKSDLKIRWETYKLQKKIISCKNLILILSLLSLNMKIR